jgi:hypothetical protein
MSRYIGPCLCGDTECPECGSLQGTLSQGRKRERPAPAYTAREVREAVLVLSGHGPPGPTGPEGEDTMSRQSGRAVRGGDAEEKVLPRKGPLCDNPDCPACRLLGRDQ